MSVSCDQTRHTFYLLARIFRMVANHSCHILVWILFLVISLQKLDSFRNVWSSYLHRKGVLPTNNNQWKERGELKWTRTIWNTALSRENNDVEDKVMQKESVEDDDDEEVEGDYDDFDDYDDDSEYQNFGDDDDDDEDGKSKRFDTFNEFPLSRTRRRGRIDVSRFGKKRKNKNNFEIRVNKPKGLPFNGTLYLTEAEYAYLDAHPEGDLIVKAYVDKVKNALYDTQNVDSSETVRARIEEENQKKEKRLRVAKEMVDSQQKAKELLFEGESRPKKKRKKPGDIEPRNMPFNITYYNELIDPRVLINSTFYRDKIEALKKSKIEDFVGQRTKASPTSCRDKIEAIKKSKYGGLEEKRTKASPEEKEDDDDDEYRMMPEQLPPPRLHTTYVAYLLYPTMLPIMQEYAKQPQSNFRKFFRKARENPGDVPHNDEEEEENIEFPPEDEEVDRMAFMEERSALWEKYIQWIRRTHLIHHFPDEVVNKFFALNGVIPQSARNVTRKVIIRAKNGTVLNIKEEVRPIDTVSQPPPLPLTPILSSKVFVKNVYTLLSTDNLFPIGQLMIMQANSSDDLQRYLQLEPLHQGLGLSWEVIEYERFENQYSLDFRFNMDPILPFCVLSMSPKPSKQACKAAITAETVFESEEEKKEGEEDTTSTVAASENSLPMNSSTHTAYECSESTIAEIDETNILIAPTPSYEVKVSPFRENTFQHQTRVSIIGRHAYINDQHSSADNHLQEYQLHVQEGTIGESMITPLPKSFYTTFPEIFNFLRTYPKTNYTNALNASYHFHDEKSTMVPDKLMYPLHTPSDPAKINAHQEILNAQEEREAYITRDNFGNFDYVSRIINFGYTYPIFSDEMTRNMTASMIAHRVEKIVTYLQSSMKTNKKNDSLATTEAVSPSIYTCPFDPLDLEEDPYSALIVDTYKKHYARGSPTGRLALINARHNTDLYLYLKDDPLFQRYYPTYLKTLEDQLREEDYDFPSLWQEPPITTLKGTTTAGHELLIAPINMIDCHGMNHVQPESYTMFEMLHDVNFMEPYDVLTFNETYTKDELQRRAVPFQYPFVSQEQLKWYNAYLKTVRPSLSSIVDNMKQRCDGWMTQLTAKSSTLSTQERHLIQQQHDHFYENMQTLRLLIFANQTFNHVRKQFDFFQMDLNASSSEPYDEELYETIFTLRKTPTAEELADIFSAFPTESVKLDGDGQMESHLQKQYGPIAKSERLRSMKHIQRIRKDRKKLFGSKGFLGSGTRSGLRQGGEEGNEYMTGGGGPNEIITDTDLVAKQHVTTEDLENFLRRNGK